MPQQQDRTAARLLVPDVARPRGRWARLAAGWAVLLAVLGHGVIGAWLLPGHTKVPASPGEKNSIQVFFDRPEVATPARPATPQPQPQPQPPVTTPHVADTHETSDVRHVRMPVSTPAPAHATRPRPAPVPQTVAAADRQTDAANATAASAHAQQATTAARPATAQPATTLHCTPPAWRYPPMARHMHEEGSAQVDLVIGAQGQVVQATLHSSTGYDDLDSTAVAAARGVHCTSDGGTPEGTHLMLPVVFHLKG